MINTLLNSLFINLQYKYRGYLPNIQNFFDYFYTKNHFFNYKNTYHLTKMFSKIRQTPINTIIWILSIGLLATIWGYRFGDFDHVEQLPLVKKAINSNYLIKDFFININQEHFSPRNYYIYMVAFLSKITSLPAAFFLITLFF